jgi:hypothetical protein
MKLPRTVGLAVAVSLVVATVAAALACISGAAPAGDIANVVDADVSPVKSLPAPSSSTSEVTLFHFRKLLMAPGMRCRTDFRSLEHIQQGDK